jgi:hypothetical protein
MTWILVYWLQCLTTVPTSNLSTQKSFTKSNMRRLFFIYNPNYIVANDESLVQLLYKGIRLLKFRCKGSSFVNCIIDKLMLARG